MPVTSSPQPTRSINHETDSSLLEAFEQYSSELQIKKMRMLTMINDGLKFKYKLVQKNKGATLTSMTE